MVGLIQRLLQLLVLVAIGFLIWKPEVLPQPAQGMAKQAQRFVIGEDVSWQGFINNWQQKWQFIASTTHITSPEPQTITADSVMKFIVESIMVQPVRKWEQIKGQLYAHPSPSTTSGEAR